MTFFKKLNIVLAIIIAITMAVCVYFIIDVNKRFPKAKETTEECVSWKGFEIKPIEAKVYTVDSFNDSFPDVPYYKYLAEKENKEKYYIFSAKVKVTNKTTEKKVFNLSASSNVEVNPLTFSNGGPILDSNEPIEPGDSQIQTIAVLCSPSLADYSRCKTMVDNKLELVISYYPERLTVKYDTIEWGN